MMVIFVSQCEKKALKRTRRVLDAFADRIGDNTWQTVITEEGLQAVKKLLRQTASKNTAVSCHWIRSRARSDLLWVVGQRNKFDSRGIVPVNYTENEVDMYQDDYRWKTLPLIKAASIIAALFHDMGKATKLFQNKIDPNKKTNKNYEPYRHEWLSLRLFEAFVLSCGDDKSVSDEEWITRFADGDFDNIQPPIRDDKTTDNKNPLKELPPFAQLVGWLILSHHRLPVYPDREDKHNNPPSFSEIELWFDNQLSAVWNSHKCQNDDEKDRLDDNWQFKELAYNSRKWSANATTLISKHKNDILAQIKGRENFLCKDLFTTHISRLALMMADHHVSSLSIEDTTKKLEEYEDKKYELYANTEWQDDTKVFKQRLDQHLIGVAIHAEKICKKLPVFQRSLPSLPQNMLLEHLISKKEIKEDKKGALKHFRWQNDVIKTSEKIADKTPQHGFFGINMASTGKGKTRANAKIMYALGKATGQIRFNVALGLRTLTLQTGKEFQEDLDIDKKDISIAVGGIAVKELFARNQRNEKKDNEPFSTGSDSADDVLNSEFLTEYDGTIDKDSHSLFQWTTKRHNRNKHRINKLILPPVLVCTIDHLIPATEGIRGGQQIAPMLRLLGSDLILDEPDDFNLSDLPALCRLVHWAGLLGRRVLLSTATMPPPLVYACFDAYKAGWSHYAKANLGEWDGNIQCAWFDEFNTNEDLFNDFQSFKKSHGRFVDERITELAKQPAKRKGKIVNISESNKGQSVYQNMADTIRNSINELHNNHHVSKDNKNVSIGLVRMANIDPMVAVAKNLLAMDAPENTHIHYVVYHGRYPLAIRSYIEEKLDYILKRKDSDRLWGSEKGIGDIVNNSEVNNHIFVVLASPVAEVGRDHDYDWAIIEPSSMRSIVQIAGRVLRHRNLDNDWLSERVHVSKKGNYQLKGENIYLLNKNIKGLKGKDVCFAKPGFESSSHPLTEHDLNKLLNISDYAEISATPKIQEPNGMDLNKKESDFLVDLEYKTLYSKVLFDKNAYSASQWWREELQWSGQLQSLQKFRKSKKDETYHLFLKSGYEEKPTFYWFDPKDKEQRFKKVITQGTQVNIETTMNNKGDNVRFWFDLAPLAIYQKLITEFTEKGKSYDLQKISEKFGGIKVIHYDNNPQTYYYHYQFGLYNEI